ncbi:hypothetical protein QQ056_17540 [Oscillatoria laete-virens NRMC-F 0139]|nr:hypothetical protein [Oscillatoria laete-virens]MDL5055338.1 hypothetical protein [Oscillatoria laete-virens NRMC-F 0139]
MKTSGQGKSIEWENNRQPGEVLEFLEGRKKISIIELAEFLGIETDAILMRVQQGQFIADKDGASSEGFWKLPVCQVRAWCLNNLEAGREQ